MAIQIPDLVFYQDKAVRLLGISSAGLFDPAALMLNPQTSTSICVRGYQVTYATNDDQLVVSDIKVNHLEFHQGQLRTAKGPEINGVEPQTLANDCFNNDYRNLNLPLSYSGGLLIGDNQRSIFGPSNRHLGLPAAWGYESVTELVFQEGRLHEVFDRSAAAQQLFEEFFPESERKKLYRKVDAEGIRLAMRNLFHCSYERSSDPKRKREELGTLYNILLREQFAYLPNGIHDLSDLDFIVSLRYPQLCDDFYSCYMHCQSGIDDPEWQHRVWAAVKYLDANDDFFSYSPLGKARIDNDRTPPPVYLISRDISPPIWERARTTMRRKLRNTDLTQGLLKLHQYRCQICGTSLETVGGERYAETHHLCPLAAPYDGPDVVENTLVLCPNHHALMDYGAMRINETELRSHPDHTIHPDFIRFHNSKIYLGSEPAEPDDRMVGSPELLFQKLRADSFAFVEPGDLSIEELYDLVRDRYPRLCDDSLSCNESCHTGNETPEWKHQVRMALWSECVISGRAGGSRFYGLWRYRNERRVGFGTAFDRNAPIMDQATTYLTRVVRESSLSRKINALHDYRCQVCGQTLQLFGGEDYAETHHIKPLGAPDFGPDIAGNIIVLCPNHHALCDFAWMQLDLDTLRSHAGHRIDPVFVDYHNAMVRRNQT